MRKFLNCIIFSLMLCLCMATSASAETVITISEDFTTLTYEDTTYTGIDASILDCGELVELETEVSLSETQQANIDEVYLTANPYKNVIHVEIKFHNGSSFSVDFLKDRLLDAYEDVKSGKTENLLIDFGWPEDNTVPVYADTLHTNAVTLEKYDLDWCQYFPVVAPLDGGSVSACVGSLLIVDEHFYYVDFIDAGLEPDFYFYPKDYTQLEAYEITDPTLLKQLEAAENNYYEDDLGFVSNDDFSQSVAIVFCSLIFGLLPLILFAVFLILGLRSKTVYRKMFFTIAVLSGFVLILFGILAFLFMTNM